MKESLAFQITNDLLFACFIMEDVILPSKVQELIQARLNLDPRFRSGSIIHLARPEDFMYPDEPCCGQIGNTACTDTIAGVTCIKCLAGYGNSIRATGICSR